jgi:hypothetical protein
MRAEMGDGKCKREKLTGKLSEDQCCRAADDCTSRESPMVSLELLQRRERAVAERRPFAFI